MKILDVPQSGSIAGQTSSHNRFGQYRRTRAIPTNPNSSFQTAVRARLADGATEYRNLTAGQRVGWEGLGEQIIRTDSLGQSYTLTGLQAYLLNNNNRRAAGVAIVSDAPELEYPSPLETLVITLTTAAFSLAFTPTPKGAGERVFCYCSPQRSAGRAYESDLRLVQVSSDAQVSPINVYAAYIARFGATVLGNRVFVEIRSWYAGFLSTAISGSAVVTAP